MNEPRFDIFFGNEFFENVDAQQITICIIIEFVVNISLI
jgi:hypothetical protein